LAAIWDRRFFRSTRGRIVTLLRRSGRTVEGLARELGLTDNGVRAHLATLERDGVVRQRGSVRRGSGGDKPAYVYELTPEEACRIAEALLTELTGLPIHEHCDRDESSPRSCFEVANPQAAEGE
jgi:predicted ArsR family transcriptional regulator